MLMTRPMMMTASPKEAGIVHHASELIVPQTGNRLADNYDDDDDRTQGVPRGEARIWRLLVRGGCRCCAQKRYRLDLNES